MKVCSSPIGPFVQRLNAVLEAKKLEYEVEYVDLTNLPDVFENYFVQFYLNDQRYLGRLMKTGHELAQGPAN